MSKFLPALLAGVLTLSAFTCPSYAADTAPGAASSDSTQALASVAVLPVRMLGVASALAIGAPIAITRCEAKSFGQYGQAMASELNTYQFVTPLMVASIPGQAILSVGAAGKGLWASAVNARDGWNTPFSAKSFSLESPEE